VRPYLEKPFTKTGLVEWLKVKALSSSPSTTKKKKNPNFIKDPHNKAPQRSLIQVPVTSPCSLPLNISSG
jgi:hypothetical protein